MPTNAMRIPRPTESVSWKICEPIHSQAAGCGPHSVVSSRVSITRMPPASIASARRRVRPPVVGVPR